MPSTMHLTPTDAYYASTCFPKSDHPNPQALHDWKFVLRLHADYSLPFPFHIDDLSHIFRNLGCLHKHGAFEKRTIQDYMEDLGYQGHNELIRRRLSGVCLNIASDIGDKLQHSAISPAELQRELKLDATHCSVRVARLADGYAETFFGAMKLPLNPVLNVSGTYAFVHGFEKGAGVPIRRASRNDFERFSEYFINNRLKNLEDVV